MSPPPIFLLADFRTILPTSLAFASELPKNNDNGTLNILASWRSSFIVGDEISRSTWLNHPTDRPIFSDRSVKVTPRDFLNARKSTPSVPMVLRKLIDKSVIPK